MSETLIKVEGVSKKFCRSLKKSLWYGMQDLGREVTGRKHGGNGELRPDEFWAVKDVSFELKRGECIGLVGRNGAGKTTLLKILNGIIKPDSGKVTIKGRIGAIIALGAGFNPILSGRENIYVNASILGISKSEIDAKLDDILDFADIGDSIDMPVQTYSSGMSVRLGFAVATALEPDVLLLDEVLAVGDASFRHKCYHRINSIMSKCAVILVSHSMEQIAAVASSVGLMNKGQYTYFPDVQSGINAYDDINNNSNFDGGKVLNFYPPITAAKVQLKSETIPYRGQLTVSIDLTCSDPVENLLISFTGVNESFQSVMNWNSKFLSKKINLPTGESRLEFTIDPLLLHRGKYQWNLWISNGGIEALVYAMHAGSFVVTNDLPPISNIPYLPDPKDLKIIHKNSTPSLSTEEAQLIQITT